MAGQFLHPVPIDPACIVHADQHGLFGTLSLERLGAVLDHPLAENVGLLRRVGLGVVLLFKRLQRAVVRIFAEEALVRTAIDRAELLHEAVILLVECVPSALHGRFAYIAQLRFEHFAHLISNTDQAFRTFQVGRGRPFHRHKLIAPPHIEGVVLDRVRPVLHIVIGFQGFQQAAGGRALGLLPGTEHLFRQPLKGLV